MESDEELMRAVARGDERALGLLVERHAPKLHAYLTRLTGQPADADDLMQETWVRVARGAGEFDAGRRFRPWAYGIATNLARDLWRRARVRARPLPPPPTHKPDPELRLDLARRVAGLPKPLREVVTLRYFAGLGEAEMAEALGIPPGTVKSRLHRAVRELRRGWEES
jgi:RNA polymerase sigma-70 factor (ECF subfamily)